jgi:hypothetical protein
VCECVHNDNIDLLLLREWTAEDFKILTQNTTKHAGTYMKYTHV